MMYYSHARRASRWGLAVLTWGVLLWAAAPAQAQDSPDETNESSESASSDGSGGDSSSDNGEKTTSKGKKKKLTKKEKEKLLNLLKNGRQAFSAGEFQKSFSLLQKAYALKPDPEYLYRMGLCQDRSNQPKKALEYYRKYLEEKPNS